MLMCIFGVRYSLPSTFGFNFECIFSYLNFILVLSSLSESWTVSGSHAEAAASATHPGRILSGNAGRALC